MPSTAAVTNFDYAALDNDTASFVQQQTGEIRALMRRATQDIFEIGQKLIEIKKRLGHGNYGKWLKIEFAWTERTAERFTSVAETFGINSDMMSDLDFAPTALYTLAAPSIPESARQEALERAKAGEFISAKKAQAIKQKYPTNNVKSQKTSKKTEKKSTIDTPVEIVDAELEELKSSPTDKETVRENEIVSNSEASATPPLIIGTGDDGSILNALPPSSEQWWCLSWKEQKHLLFCGHPDAEKFRAISPQEVGIWLSFPPTPADWIVPSKRILANVSLYFSSIYTDLDLKIVGKTLAKLISEASCEEDKTAIITQLKSAPLLELLNQFEINCFIAEPDSEQCQEILSVWQQLGGEVEKLEVSSKIAS